ncbi:MAG: hypothetical protein M0C28_35430 [Candidatus Moduliflexus flocculans]|nr:hypothetical protein [Candidatus Moduliflexus flocculans]
MSIEARWTPRAARSLDAGLPKGKTRRRMTAASRTRAGNRRKKPARSFIGAQRSHGDLLGEQRGIVLKQRAAGKTTERRHLRDGGAGRGEGAGRRRRPRRRPSRISTQQVTTSSSRKSSGPSAMSTVPAKKMTASAQTRRTTGRTIRTQRQDRFQASGTSSPALSRWGEGTGGGRRLIFGAGGAGRSGGRGRRGRRRG